MGVDYILRAVKLRREGRIGIVLVCGGRYYIARNPSDPWGSKKYITNDDLRTMIDQIDPVQMEGAG